MDYERNSRRISRACQPRLLEYRKTVTVDTQFAAVEWSDEGSCFTDVNGKNTLIVWAGLEFITWDTVILK